MLAARGINPCHRAAVPCWLCCVPAAQALLPRRPKDVPGQTAHRLQQRGCGWVPHCCPPHSHHSPLRHRHACSHAMPQGPRLSIRCGHALWRPRTCILGSCLHTHTCARMPRTYVLLFGLNVCVYLYLYLCLCLCLCLSVCLSFRVQICSTSCFACWGTPPLSTCIAEYLSSSLMHRGSCSGCCKWRCSLRG